MSAQKENISETRTYFPVQSSPVDALFKQQGCISLIIAANEFVWIIHAGGVNGEPTNDAQRVPRSVHKF